MALPQNRPFNEVSVYARTTSIGTSPVAGKTVATKKGYVVRAFAYSEGSSTGTITVTVANGSTTIGTLSLTGGADAIGSAEFTQAASSAVAEGDTLSFTPAGGGGATIPGHFYAVIRG